MRISDWSSDVCSSDLGRIHGKPVLTCIGGAQRGESVRAGLLALPDSVSAADPVLVHDAARPCITRNDITRLLAAAAGHPVGALLGAPVRDTLNHANSEIGRASCRERVCKYV